VAFFVYILQSVVGMSRDVERLATLLLHQCVRAARTDGSHWQFRPCVWVSLNVCGSMLWRVQYVMEVVLLGLYLHYCIYKNVFKVTSPKLSGDHSEYLRIVSSLCSVAGLHCFVACSQRSSFSQSHKRLGQTECVQSITEPRSHAIVSIGFP